MDKKIIFFDADGTIQNTKGISSLTKEAFKMLRANNHILVLSTGRALPSIDGYLGEMNFENIICSGGNCVVINNEIVYENIISKENQKELCDYFERNNILYNMETKDHIWIKKENKDKYISLFDDSIPNKEVVSAEEYNKAIQRVKRISNRTWEIDDPMKLDIYKIHYYNSPISNEQIEKDLKGEFHIVSLSLNKGFAGGEISEKGITKKTGMDIILNYFNVKKENIYAIGDDYNDIEMLEYATTGIAMGQAPKAVKQSADYITEDLEHDGFYHAMKHFKLI